MAKRVKNDRKTKRRTYRKKTNRLSNRKRINKKTKKRNNKPKIKRGGGGISDIRIKPLFDIEKYSDQNIFGINPNLKELLNCFTDNAKVITTILGKFKDAFYIPFYTKDDILASFDENKGLLFLAQTLPLKIDSSGKIFKIKIDDLNSDLAIQNILNALAVLNQGQIGGRLEAFKAKLSGLKERMREGTEQVQKAISEKTSEFGQKIKEFSFKRSLGDLFITLVKNLTGKFRKGLHEISLSKTKEGGIHRINIHVTPNGKKPMTAVLLESRGKYHEIKQVLEEREKLLLAISDAATPDNLDVVSEKTEEACIKDDGFKNNKELKKVLSETQKLSNYMGEIKSETQSLSPSPVSEPLQPPQELQQEIENLEPPLQAPAPISLETVSEITDQTQNTSSGTEIKNLKIEGLKKSCIKDNCDGIRGAFKESRKNSCIDKCDKKARENY